MTQEALKLALEALEYWDVHGKLHQPTEEAITAIKEALAQPEQEPVNKNGSPCPEFWDWLPKAYNFENFGNFTIYNMEVAFLAGKQASQPEQEPVAWPCLIDSADFSENTITLVMQCENYKVSSGMHWLSTTPAKENT